MTAGVYPMWNPYSAWGGPELLDMRALGEFNPFLYLVVLFAALGIPFYKAYLLYMASYYFLGGVGLYLLAKLLWRDRLLAYTGFLSFLFSSLGPAVFTENVLIYLTVPAIWFFYFLFKLQKDNAFTCCLGITFCVMVILTTYLPFYFLYILGMFVLASVLFNRRSFWARCQEILLIAGSSPRLSAFCVLAVLCSVVPGVQWYTNAQSPEYLLNFQHRQSSQGEFLSVDPGNISAGSISGMMDWDRLISGLNIFPGQETAVFYLSVMVYVLLVLSMFTERARGLTVLFFLGMALFMAALADVSSVYRFLYEHVGVLKLVRNLFFFVYLLIPIVILFALGQARSLLSAFQNDESQPAKKAVFVIIMYVLMLAVILSQEDIIVSTYVVLAGSFVLFILLFLRRIGWGSPGIFILFVILLLLQPVEVLYYWTGHVQKAVTPLRQEGQQPVFMFQRPSPEKDARIPGAAGYAAELKWMSDRSGLVDAEYVGLKRIYELQQNVDPGVLFGYARHKFWLYDNVRSVDPREFNFADFELSLAQMKNEAMVFGPEGGIASKNVQGTASTIVESDRRFKLIAFGLNDVKFKTFFPEKKFLVYNDGFHHNWQAFVNGVPARLWQANYAFKGLWLEAGENTVYLRYGSVGTYIFYTFLALLMVGILVTLVLGALGYVGKFKAT